MELAERLFAQSASTGRPLALLLLDIDHFKQITDRCGHDIGDRAIRSTTEVVGKVLPVDAVCGRMGGEEFMIMLPGTTHQEALGLAESFRYKVSEHSIHVGGIAIDLSISTGVAECTADITRLDELYRIADQALYASRHQGRDHIAN